MVRWENPDGICNLDGLAYVESFEPRKDFDACAHFENEVGMKLRLEIDNWCSGSVVLDDREELVELLFGDTSPIEGNYIVISPYRWVHEKVEKYCVDKS